MISGEPTWVLTVNDRPLLNIGHVSTVEKNRQLESCLRENFQNNRIAKFNAVFTRGEYYSELDQASLTCQTIDKAKDCPETLIRTETVQGIYQGVVCGDFCHLSFKLDNGFEDSILANEEKVEKLFGTEPGKRVSITYEVKMDWMPDSMEGDNLEPGTCTYDEIFTTGKVLSDK